MATGNALTALERCLVTPPPPPATAAHFTLPLTFLDLLWLYISPVQRLIFYQLPLSSSHFVSHFIPKLKDSLSLALKDFLPVAGNLVYPSSSIDPEIRYTTGDGVPLTLAESNGIDFDYLVADYARWSSEFQPLVPNLQKYSSDDSGEIVMLPVFAIQVTLFPNVGISVGIANHHALGDASSIFSFMKAWSLHSKLGENATSILDSESLSLYDKTVIEDKKGIGSIFLNQLRSLNLDSRGGNLNILPSGTNRVRATFVLGLEQIQKLKNFVQNKRPTLKHLSSFTVTCAYVWSCRVKSLAACGEAFDEEELEHFVCMADCRSRLDPPLSPNYFGNCLILCAVTAKSGELAGDEGFTIAAERIGEVLHQKLHCKDEILKGAETWITTTLSFNWDRAIGVAGSTRHNYYDLDFGWGKPRKFEFISIDDTGAISLSGCKESEGSVEVGLSLSKPRIDAFACFFNKGLKAL